MVIGAIPGCGGGSSGSTPSQQPRAIPLSNFAGRFQGTDQGTQAGVPFQANLAVTLTQNGDQVSGDYAETGETVTGVSGFGGGSLSGSATGNSLSITGINQSSGCTFSGTATLINNGNELTGTASNPESAGCPAANATFDLFRQGAPSPTPTVTVTPAPSGLTGTFSGTGTITAAGVTKAVTVTVVMTQTGGTVTGSDTVTVTGGRPATGTFTGPVVNGTAFDIFANDLSCPRGNGRDELQAILAGNLLTFNDSICNGTAIIIANLARQ